MPRSARRPSEPPALATGIEPLAGPVPTLIYRWDSETEILAARFESTGGRGFTGSVEYEGDDGAFLLVDVQSGVVCGVEVVVWPDLATRSRLAPPRDARNGRLVVPARPSQPGVGAVEVEQPIAGETIDSRSIIHLRIGEKRPVTPVLLADLMMAEVDAAGGIAGFWLLDVPPLPEPPE